MKKAFSILLLAVFIMTSLCACSQPDHEETLSQIASQNASKNAVRQEFLDSDVCKEAYKYVEDVLKELVPNGNYEISLEPGSLQGESLEGFSDFSENEQTRLEFFSKAKLSFKVNFWDFDIDGIELSKELIKRQISGRMNAAETGSDCYMLNAVNKDFYFVRSPEV